MARLTINDLGNKLDKMMSIVESLDKRITALESPKQQQRKQSAPEETKKQSASKKQTEKKEYGDSHIAIVPVTDTKVKIHVCDEDWLETQSFKYRSLGNKAIGFFLKQTFGAEWDTADFTLKLTKGEMKKLFNDKHHVKGSNYRFIFTSAEISSFMNGRVSTKKEVSRAKEARQF